MKKMVFVVVVVVVVCLCVGLSSPVLAAEFYTNLALTATASASSVYQNDPSYAAIKIKDGYFNLWDTGEWASWGEGAGAWVKLTWTSAQVMNQIWIYPRPNAYDMIYDSNLEIDADGDGTADYTIRPGMIPQGGAPKIINLTTAQGAAVRSIKFIATQVSPQTYNTGLAEIECYYKTAVQDSAIPYSTFVGYQAGNSNTSAGVCNSFFGHQAGQANTTGYFNNAVGYQALYSNTIGYDNTAVGYQALGANTTGNYNNAVGYQALFSNTTGYDNNAVGYRALYYNTTGYDNTAMGDRALCSNTTGYDNTAMGDMALYSNTTGNYNNAVGFQALYSNTAGDNNNAVGFRALYSNTTGYNNTAMGDVALYFNTTGYNNTAMGDLALYSNTTGSYNTAIGYQAGYFNTTGYYNNAMGDSALFSNTTGNYNTAMGDMAGYYNTGGTYNTFIGYDAGVASGSGGFTNATAIGNGARVDANNKVRIGNALVTVCEAPVAWTLPSDIRIKKNITDNDTGLEFILGLRPVHFEMKKGHEGIIYDGFIAQDVEEVMNELGITFSGLVKPDNPDNMYSLSYTTFVVPLVNAIKEQQNQIKEQQNQIEELKKRIEALEG